MSPACWLGRVLLFSVVVFAACRCAAPALAQDPQFRERDVLDPETDQWRDMPAEPPGAPGDELDQLRGMIARGEAKAANKRLKKWVAANISHERYLEGVMLFGESFFERQWYWEAYEQFEIVAEGATGELFRAALRREMDVARAFLAGKKRRVLKIFRLPAYDDGVKILDKIWERVPGTRMGELALKLKADYFFKSGELQSAQDEYVHMTKEYPSGRYTRQSAMRAAEAAAAAFPGIAYDERPLLDAQQRYQAVEKAYPDYAEEEHVADRLEGIRSQRAEKDLYIASWYERTGRRGAAEFYYRQIIKDWPDTLAETQARTRLRALGIDLSAEERRP